MSNEPLNEPVNELLRTDDARAAAAEKARLLMLEFDEDLRTVMASPQGRRFIWRLIDRAGMWRSSWTERREGTDFREGERNTALRLWADLQRACPESLLRMQKENRPC